MAIIKTGEIAEKVDPGTFLHSIDADNEFVICKRPDKLNMLLQAACSGHDIHFLSDGDWSMHDLVNELLKKYHPAELFFTTYALREFSVRQLINALDKNLLVGVTCLIDYKAKSRTPDAYQLASMNVNRIYLTQIHAKVMVLRSPEGCVSVVSSANWTSNPRIECGVLSTRTDVAEFHINWIENVLSHAEIFK